MKILIENKENDGVMLKHSLCHAMKVGFLRKKS